VALFVLRTVVEKDHSQFDHKFHAPCMCNYKSLTVM